MRQVLCLDRGLERAVAKRWEKPLVATQPRFEGFLELAGLGSRVSAGHERRACPGIARNAEGGLRGCRLSGLRLGGGRVAPRPPGRDAHQRREDNRGQRPWSAADHLIPLSIHPGGVPPYPL